MSLVAALFVASDGPYIDIPNIDAWDRERDARNYDGPYPVIAHPPCERWGRYWSGGPSAKQRRLAGDDKGCFWAALMAVRKFGGVLEHPEASLAWRFFSLTRPPKKGGWVAADSFGGMTCEVEQGHYGHKARKATWLYAVSRNIPELTWGPSSGERLEEGFHSTWQRIRAREKGVSPIKRISKKDMIYTPKAFRQILFSIAVGAK